MKNKILEILCEVQEGKRSINSAENELSTLLYENKAAIIQALTNLLKVAQTKRTLANA